MRVIRLLRATVWPLLRRAFPRHAEAMTVAARHSAMVRLGEILRRAAREAGEAERGDDVLTAGIALDSCEDVEDGAKRYHTAGLISDEQHDFFLVWAARYRQTAEDVLERHTEGSA